MSSLDELASLARQPRRVNPPDYFGIRFFAAILNLLAVGVIFLGFAQARAWIEVWPIMGAFVFLGASCVAIGLILLSSMAHAIRDVARNSWWLRRM